MIGWVVFRATTLGGAASYLTAMFGGGLQVDAAASTAFLTADRLTLLLVGAAIALVPAGAFTRFRQWPRLAPTAAKASALLCFVYSLSVLADRGFNPFIYFRF
jgi:alginate O-acetyltransferase complex protein AlgI